MTYITLEDQYVTPFIENNEFIEMSERVQQAHKQLHEKNGIGSNYLGWLDLPETFDEMELQQIEQAPGPLYIEADEQDLDGLNYLVDHSLAEINEKAFYGALAAHVDGGVPNIVLNIPTLNAFTFGYLVYFFEKACAISGYVLGVNPFDQPGVENYKNNMFKLLGKPGY